MISSAKTVAGQASKRDRQDCDSNVSATKSAKIGDAAEATREFVLSDDGLIRCSIKEFKGRTYVDIRTHYKVRGLYAIIDCSNQRTQDCNRPLL